MAFIFKHNFQPLCQRQKKLAFRCYQNSRNWVFIGNIFFYVILVACHKSLNFKKNKILSTCSI